MRKAFVLLSLLLGGSLAIFSVNLLGNFDEGVQAAARQLSESGQGNIFTVCKSGGCDYMVIQDAVAAALNGDVIKVAAGVYTNVYGIRQEVVFIGENLTLRGGYTDADFTDPPDPIANPTIIDGENNGRGIHVSGDLSVTIEGFHVTGGYAGPSLNFGGGIFVQDASIVLSNSILFENRAEGPLGKGGGFAANGRDVRLLNNYFYSNTTNAWGGAASIGSSEGAVIVQGNVFSENQSLGNAGGLLLDGGAYFLVKENSFTGNAADRTGGLRLNKGNFLVQNNYFEANKGGGIGMYSGAIVTLTGNSILSNTVSAIEVEMSEVTLISNTIAHNTDLMRGALFAGSSRLELIDNDLSYNGPGDRGHAIFIENSYLTMTSNLVSHNYASGASGLMVWTPSTVTLKANTFISNVVTNSGAVMLRGNATVVDNIFSYNRSDHSYGALYMIGPSNYHVENNLFSYNEANTFGALGADQGGTVLLENNRFISNKATDLWGGAIHIGYVTATLRGNLILSNTANHSGGGLYGDGSRPLTLTHNIFAGNYAGDLWGGGATIAWGSGLVLLERNIFFNNRALAGGGALNLISINGRLTNNLFYSNTAQEGAGIRLYDGLNHFTYNTLAFNEGDSAIHLENDASTWFSNTIIAGHETGMTVDGNASASLEGTLWDNQTDWQGPGTIVTGSINLTGDPGFADPENGDFHLLGTSQAIDAGIDAGVVTDFDGDPRPLRAAFDIGFDELPPLPRAIFGTSSPDWFGQTTQFTNHTVATTTTDYLWDFDDGTFSKASEPEHTYAQPGEYAVILTATNQAGSDTYSENVIVYSRPVVSFTFSPQAGISPLVVRFREQVDTIPPGDFSITYHWDFGDGGSTGSDNPQYVYNTAGIYTVTLTAYNVVGSSSLSQTEAITVYEPAVADFSAAPLEGIAPLTVTFANESSGDFDTCHWDFGDGQENDDCGDAFHLYEVPGTYNVTLSAEGIGGVDVEAKTDYIKVRYGVYLPIILAE